jgi:hypothetical protein
VIENRTASCPLAPTRTIASAKTEPNAPTRVTSRTTDNLEQTMDHRPKVTRGYRDFPQNTPSHSVDAAGLGGPAGREPSRDEMTSSGDIEDPGGRRRSDVTDVQDDGAGDTPDGLDPLEEAARHGAEDVPAAEHQKRDDPPVFDRGDLPPKV